MYLYTRYLGVGLLAGLLASCGQSGTGGALPTSLSNPSNPTTQPTTQSAYKQPSFAIGNSLVGITGTVSGMGSNGSFTVNTGSAHGYVRVSSSSAPGNPSSLATGKYVAIVGTGSTETSIAPSFIGVFSSNPGTWTISGTVTGTTAFGFDVRTANSGIVPVMVSSATAGNSVTTGQTVSAVGNGAGSVGVLAATVSGGASPAPTSTPAPSAATHVMTADWLGSPFGANVSPSTAQPYLTWAGTGPANGNAYHAAGLKVESYADPNRIQIHDPLYDPASIAHTCSGSMVSYDYNGITQYVGNAASSSLISAYGSLVRSMQSQGHIDAVLEDNAGALDNNGSFTGYSGIPCGYTSLGWIASEAALEGSISVPTIFNGLSTLDGESVKRVEAALAREPKLQESLRLAREDRDETLTLN